MTSTAADAAAVERLAADVAAALDVAVGVAAVDGVGRAVERHAGDEAARRAFAAAGVPGAVVDDHEADGRRRWPAGWTGSVTHAAGWAIAVVGRLGDVGALGIDLERAAALDADDAALVLDATEHDEVTAADEPAAAATERWSAKEAAFKAWSTALGGLDAVDPVEIHVERSGPRVRVVATGALGPRTSGVGPLHGVMVGGGGLVVVAVRAADRR